MITATSLAQHILSLEPDKDAARLCFYDFLKNLCDGNETVDSALMSRFLRRALCFTFWQENKAHLFSETAAIMQHFLEANGQAAAFEGLWPTERLQVIEIEDQLDLIEMVKHHVEKQLGPHDQFRVLPESETRIIAIVLGVDRTLKVTSYPRWATVKDGELMPLTDDFSLYYTADLQLSPNHVQQIEVAPHVSARFRFAGEGCKGLLIRGYTFQKYGALDGGSLHRFPLLFYPLKRLEQFFINRRSDPMYIELTGILDKAVELLKSEHPEAKKFAQAALERGKLALEHIFPDDKLVRLLIDNLEKTFLLEGQAPAVTLAQQAQHSQQSEEVEECPPPNTTLQL